MKRHWIFVIAILAAGGCGGVPGEDDLAEIALQGKADQAVSLAGDWQNDGTGVFQWQTLLLREDLTFTATLRVPCKAAEAVCAPEAVEGTYVTGTSRAGKNYLSLTRSDGTLDLFTFVVAADNTLRLGDTASGRTQAFVRKVHCRRPLCLAFCEDGYETNSRGCEICVCKH